MHIAYEGGSHGLPLLVGYLQDQGVVVEYEPPLEERGAVQDIALHVLIQIVVGSVDDEAKERIRAIVRDGISKLTTRFPRVKARLEDDD